jgi:hypothetical protein
MYVQYLVHPSIDGISDSRVFLEHMNFIEILQIFYRSQCHLHRKNAENQKVPSKGALVWCVVISPLWILV